MKLHTPAAATHHHAHKVPAYVDAFIKMTLDAAKLVKSRWGVPVAVLIAQSAQETGWGQHVVNNASFGIKGKASDGKSVDFGTTEVIDGKVIHEKDTLRAYDGFADAADDYGRLLSQNERYKIAFLYKSDANRFVQEIAKAGYATDPHYARSLISIIHSHGLSQYDK